MKTMESIMKTILLATAAAATLTAGVQAQQSPAGQAQTENRFQLGAGYEATDVGGLIYDNAVFRAGYDLNPYFGIEGEGQLPIGEETSTVNGVEQDSAIDYQVGAYAKAQYPVHERVNLFARGGYSYANVRGSYLNERPVDDIDGWAYGAGAEWLVDDVNALRVDYTHRDFDSDGVADSYGVSYVRRF